MDLDHRTSDCIPEHGMLRQSAEPETHLYLVAPTGAIVVLAIQLFMLEQA